MPIPEENDLEQDPRVAWDGTWRQCGTHVERVERMWNIAPRRLGWKLTSEQLTQIQRQHDAALVRKAATRRTHHTSDAHPIAGPLAEETPTDEHDSGAPAALEQDEREDETLRENARQQAAAQVAAAQADRAQRASAAETANRLRAAFRVRPVHRWLSHLPFVCGRFEGCRVNVHHCCPRPCGLCLFREGGAYPRRLRLVCRRPVRAFRGYCVSSTICVTCVALHRRRVRAEV